MLQKFKYILKSQFYTCMQISDGCLSGMDWDSEKKQEVREQSSISVTNI